jgi:hypothetical protein
VKREASARKSDASDVGPLFVATIAAVILVAQMILIWHGAGRITATVAAIDVRAVAARHWYLPPP